MAKLELHNTQRVTPVLHFRNEAARRRFRQRGDGRLAQQDMVQVDVQHCTWVDPWPHKRRNWDKRGPRR